MAGRGASVDPVDTIVAQQVEIGLLEQDAGREARILLVERGLEGKAAGRAEEVDQHRERPLAQIERAHVELAGLGSARRYGAEPGFGVAMAGERRPRASLPPACFERQE